MENRRLLAVLHVDSTLGNDSTGDGSEASPFKSIRRGVNEAAALAGDDVLFIRPGAYGETAFVNDSSGALTLRGATGNPADVSLVAVSATLTNNVQVESISLGYDVEVLSGTADIVVENVLAKGRFYSPTSAGDVSLGNSEFAHVQVTNFQNLSIQDVNLIEAGHFRGRIFAFSGHSVTIDGADWTNGVDTGISLSDVGSATIRNASASDRTGHGISLVNLGEVVLENVTALRNRYSGINLSNVNVVELAGVDVSSNTAHGVIGRYLDAVTATNVTANDVAGQVASRGFFLIDIGSASLNGGEFHNNLHNGMELLRVSGPVDLQNVSASNNGERGLRVDAINSSVSITGGTFSGNALRGIDLNQPSGVTVRDVTVANNGRNELVNNQTDGGGISVSTSSIQPVLIDNATVTGNKSYVVGAGIHISNNGPATVSNSVVSGNTNQFGQSRGGGIYFADADGSTPDGPYVVQDSTIEQNTSLDGGGIWANGALTIQRSTIAGNGAVTAGGGVWAGTNRAVTIEQSTIAGNRAGSVGGGVRLGAGSARLANNTVSGNSSQQYGGGIYVVFGQPMLEWNTIAHNTATQAGGGVYVAAGLPRAVANIVALNDASAGPDYFGSVDSQNEFMTGGNVVGDGTDASGFGPNDQVGSAASPIDPLLGPLQDNGGPTLTHALLAGSPAIDITSEAWIEVDQRGVVRPIDGNRDGDPLGVVDAGSFEYSNTAPVAEDDEATVTEGGFVVINVLVNDDDPDGDTSTVTTVSAPSHGSAVLNGDGTITYTPAAGYHGSDSFTYGIDDGFGGTASATVTVTVVPANRDPETVDAVFSLDENSPAGTPVGQIVASDPDGDDLTFALRGADAAAFAIDPATGSISVADAALLDFESDPQLDFLVDVSDGNGGIATASVRVNLADVLEVQIDVLPDDSTNTVDLGSNELKVAILGAAGFDPATIVDLSSLRLRASDSVSGATVTRHPKHGIKYEVYDVNGDGILDLVVAFKPSETGLEAGDTSVELVGALLPQYGGDSFAVSQEVTVKATSKGGGKKKK